MKSSPRVPLDFDAGFLAGAFGVVCAATVGSIRGVGSGQVSGLGLVVLAASFGVAGMVVGSVIAGRPDFGPTRRTALVRGFLAVTPVYAVGGLLFLPPPSWFTLLPLLSVIAAALVGPPIGIFMYRLHRRRDYGELMEDPSDQLAWVKGELVGSWMPLLISIAILAGLGVGLRVVPAEQVDAGPRPPPVPTLTDLWERLPDLHERLAADSGDPGIRFELGLTLTSLGRFTDAVAHLERAAALDSLQATYWTALGRAAFFHRDAATSARAYWTALRLDPGALGSGLDRVILDAVFNQQMRDRANDPGSPDDVGRP